MAHTLTTEQLADGLFRSKSWVSSMVRKGFIDDPRPYPGQGAACHFSIREVMQAVLLAEQSLRGKLRYAEYEKKVNALKEGVDQWIAVDSEEVRFVWTSKEVYLEGYDMDEVGAKASALMSYQLQTAGRMYPERRAV